MAAATVKPKVRNSLEAIADTFAPGSAELPSASDVGVADAIFEVLADGPRETWDVRGLYVCDASAFPTSSGVNPMISIEAIAHMNARRLAESLA